MIKMLPHQKGMTLIEILVVIAIVAILAAIATPAFNELIASQRIRSAASELYSSLILARSEAIKRNNTVNLTPINPDNFGDGWDLKLAGGTTSINHQEAIKGVTGELSGTGFSFNALGRLTGGDATVTFSASGTDKTWVVYGKGSGRVCVAKGGESC